MSICIKCQGDHATGCVCSGTITARQAREREQRARLAVIIELEEWASALYPFYTARMDASQVIIDLRKELDGLRRQR